MGTQTDINLRKNRAVPVISDTGNPLPAPAKFWNVSLDRPFLIDLRPKSLS
jgi:hypothetical protein